MSSSDFLQLDRNNFPVMFAKGFSTFLNLKAFALSSDFVSMLTVTIASENLLSFQVLSSGVEKNTFLL